MRHNKIYQKTVIVNIIKNKINDKLDIFNSFEKTETKLHLIRSILELPDSFTDNIEVNFVNDLVTFKWHPAKIDQRAELLHKNALYLARKGNLNDAIKRWNQAVLINPLDPDYYFNLGVAFYEQKKYQEAIENLSRTLSICPFYTKANLILGITFLKLRKFEFAKKHLQKDIKFDKPEYLSYMNLGVVYSILKEYNDGLTMFEKAIELAPNEPRIYLGMAKIYTTLEKFEKANFYYKKVIELDKKGNLANYAKKCIVSNDIKHSTEQLIKTEFISSNAEEIYSDGYRYYIIGNYEKAILMYSKYLKLKPEDDYVWYSLGESQLRFGKIGNAVESFIRAAKLYPKRGLYFKELAIAFNIMQKPDKVIAVISKAIELGKTDSNVFCLLGKALFDLNNFDESIKMLDKSLAYNKNNFLSRYYLAKCYISINKIDDAIINLCEIKNIKINTPLKNKANDLYEKLSKKA